MRIRHTLIVAACLAWFLPRTGGAASGVGTATVAPGSATSGGVQGSTITFTVPTGGLTAGARLEVTTPPSWYPWPQITQPGQDGYVSVLTTAPVTFGLTVMSTAPTVTAYLSAGTVPAGTLIKVTFANLHVGCPLPNQTVATWKVRSVTDSSGFPSDIATQPFQTLSAGPAANLAFVPWNPLNVVAGQPVGPVVLQSQDFCGNPVPVSSTITVNLSGYYFNGTSTLADPAAVFSSFSNFTPSTTSILLPMSSSQTSFYYKTGTTGNSIWINADFINPFYLYPQTISRSVTSLATQPAFTNVAIDNGAAVANQTTTTLTPDNDGVNDVVVVRFTPSDATLTWHVTISSSSFTNTVYDRWGTGDMQSGITWDGRDILHPNSIVNNGVYTVKIEFPGLVQDTTLTATLTSAQISGHVTLGGVGVANAWVNAQSTNGGGFSSSQTDPNGLYVLNGLRSGGVYSLFASFTSTVTQANLYDSLPNITAPASSQDFAFSFPGLIRVAATLTAATPTPIFGYINAHTANYSKYYNASIRFQSGSTTSDNNDPFQPSTWSVMGVTPGSYVVETRIPGFAVSNQVVTVVANQNNDLVIPLVAKATVYGKITLPAPAASNVWVPVEVIPSGAQQPLYWGGANINVGQSTGIYSVFGIDPGTYTFRARPPNYLPATISTTIAGTTIGDATNGGLDFAGGLFTTGGQLTGTITILGDSTGIPNPSVFMNLSSQALGLYFNNALTFTPNGTSVSLPYTMNGLADGVYQVFPYLTGFETVPPGPKVATISSGAGVLNLTLAQVTGSLSGSVTLPGSNSDYNQVHVSLMGSDMREVDLGAVSYSIPNLRSGFYSLTATYATSGAQVRQNFSITNGQATVINLDMAAATYALTGTVSIQSGFTMRGSSGSIVTIGTIADLLGNATTQTLIIGGTPSPTGGCTGGTAYQVSTARVEAFPKQFGGFNDPNRSGFSNCFAVGEYKYGVIAANGTYSIPGLTPGLWEVNVYPYFDGGTVPNVGVAKQVVTIAAANQTVNFGLSGGHSVAGVLSLPAGLTDARSFDVQILSNRGAQIQSGSLDIGSGQTPAASANFIFYSLADGDYSLVLRERPTFDAALGFVTKYVAKPIAFTVAGTDVTGMSVTLARAARIVGSLAIQGKNPDGTPAVTLLTSSNASLLPSNFQVGAAAFPWVEGGFGQATTDSSGKVDLDANNQWRIEGLVAGTYDLSFRQSSFGANVAAAGALNLASVTKAQIQVTEGQTLDMGTISLVPGLSISGIVSSAAGSPLSNIRVRGKASVAQDSDGVETVTDANGQYTLMGLSPTFKTYDIEAAPRPSGNDSTPPVPYENVKKFAVDVTVIPPPKINFSLASANSSLSGLVLTADGGPLAYPEDQNAGFPAAAVYLKRQGVQGGDDPLGDIREATALDGAFQVNNLVPGTYVMTIASLGYRPYKKTLLISTGNQSLGTITLATGPSLLATLTKPNGNLVNTSDVKFAVAVTADVGSIIFGNTTSDSNTKNIKSIKFDGFELNKRYSVLLFDQLGNIIQPPEGRALTFTSDTDALTLALTYQPSRPGALTHIRKSGSDVIIEYFFTRPIRNTQTFDTNPVNFVTLNTGNGTLSGQTVSGDRRSMSVTYTPALGEQTATLTLLAYSVDIDPAAGTEYPITRTSTLLFGQKASSEGSINAALGGEVTLASSNDPSGVTLPANSLKNSDGTAASADTSYNVSFNATDDISGSSSAGIGSRASTLSAAITRGPSAYLPESWAAMQSAKSSSSLSPFSAFYSVLLPAGLSHTLNQSATLTLSYSTDADPTQINVYYFDGTKYLIESANRTIDTANKTITVGVSHFSTFVVLQNSLPVVTVNGGVSTLAEIDVFNFPNPFDLTSKTKTLTHGGTTTSITTDGTVIRYVIPAAKIGAAKIVIYNVVGEKVRSIDLGTPTADTYNYVEWDGRNDHGNKVASGVYVGELKSGSNTRFFKMAVIK